MPEPVSSIVLPLSLVALYSLARPSSAVSRESAAVQVQAVDIVSRVERSDALFGRTAAVISDLMALAISHRQAGWDGGHAAAIDRASINLAIAFVRAMPWVGRQPEVGVDPDGAVTLDWLTSRHRMLSVSFIGATCRIAYAWIDGSERGHATSHFDGREVPKRLLDTVLDFAGSTDKDGINLRAA